MVIRATAAPSFMQANEEPWSLSLTQERTDNDFVLKISPCAVSGITYQISEEGRQWSPLRRLH